MEEDLKIWSVKWRGIRFIIMTLFLSVMILGNSNLIANASVLDNAGEMRNKLNEVSNNSYFQGRWTGSGQCEGYAAQVCAAWLGSNPLSTRDWSITIQGAGVSVDTLNNSLYVGDYVRFRSTDSFDHSIVITNIEGDKVYYTDANIDGQNSIRWNVSMTKATLANYLNKQLLWNKDNSYVGSYVNGYGKYGCVIHRNGNSVKSLTKPADTEKPVITNIRVTDINRDGYTITCNVSDNVGIDRVSFPTWYEGQRGEEAIWLRGSINGNTASVRVNVSDWDNRESNYYTHIYAYDTSNNWIAVAAPSTYIDRTAPQISNARIEQIDSTGYTIVCEVNDNRGVNRVQFPTWTTYNDQDDIVEDWYSNPVSSGTRDGNTFRYRVNDSDHNFERGYYSTHIYAYDDCGNHAVYCIADVNFQNQYKANKSIVYNGHEYLLFDDLLSWDNAKRQCERMGGYLVTITSQDEQNAVNKLLSGAKRRGYFLGASDLNGKSSFGWITGEPFNYTNWNPGEPSHSDGIEHYIELLNDEGRWNDISNSPLNRGFILEKVITNKIQNVVINPTSLALKAKAASAQLKAIISPANATNKTVTWKSSNSSVATVDKNGKVTAVSNGTANITVTTQDGNKTATCKLTVNIPKPAEPTKPVTPDKPSVSATSIKLNKPSLTLYKGKTYTLKATVKPKTYNSGVKWSSSANKYATVSSKGKITAKKSGRTVITAQTKNGKKATCIVKVKERKATKVKLSRKSLTLKVGRKFALKATVYPKNTTDTKKWTINKKGIVKVSSKGVLTGLKKGRCRITLKTSSGKSAYCNVKVE